ncbi:MAG: dipeptidase PepE [Ferruginibacter sp.]
MPQKKVLAFSSSREGDSNFLESAAPLIKDFLGEKHLNVGFIPFADVNNDYDAYANKVSEALINFPYTIQSLTPANAQSLVETVDIIMVGGGNTFKLLHDIYSLNIFELIKTKVSAGTPYIGWSAGSNLTSPGIYTSNDMPIIEPASFKAFGFFPFQLNPHYYNFSPPGFNGETRDQRLEEFLLLNQHTKVLGLPEGTALLLDKGMLSLKGSSTATLFNYNKTTGVVRKEINPGEDLTNLLQAV